MRCIDLDHRFDSDRRDQQTPLINDIVQMDKMSAPSSWERAQSLYEKNIELENRRRRSAQARIPSDPNAWLQMRENCEAIILEDNSFSEQHNIEYTLWQLHYRRIEELRAHFSAALASPSSKTSQSVLTRPDRVSKIRLQFKTFLSEATGFYHDLIMKIRSKYGLPLGYFSEDSDNLTVMEKDEKKSSDIKKGLVSCHRCLIYLGDLARYKGLYGEVDSKSREYAAASGYYLQAASVWPSSGNPHNQLAIIASYSGDELVAIYRYFRSLAVDSPFSTARDNLIVAFEKNRQSYSQQPGDVKSSVVKESYSQFVGKGRRKGDAKVISKDRSREPSPLKERGDTIQDKYKFFCTRFIRLNGILFTRTSLETFVEVLSLVNSGLSELLSSGPEEELNFGSDSSENSLVIVRVISILIFTIHNASKETEGQTYAEIVQRDVLLQNAYVAAFELVGCIVERCLQLRDPSSSFLLPGILVFVEWLACCPEIAASSETDFKEATFRSSFWNLCVSLFNKLLLNGPTSIEDDEDETCFYNMSRYVEGETENRLALWEDFELRGFVPLLPAQAILNFSRKRAFGNGGKEKSARIKRIIAAGKVLANMVRINQKSICFDSKTRKFIIGVESGGSDDFATSSILPNTGMMHETEEVETKCLGVVQSNPQVFVDEEEDDEVIVFKPLVTEKKTDMVEPEWVTVESLGWTRNASAGDVKFLGVSGSVSPKKLQQQKAFDASPLATPSIGDNLPHHLQQLQSHALKWPTEDISLVNGMKDLRLLENGHMGNYELQRDKNISNLVPHSLPIQQATIGNSGGMFYNEQKPREMVMSSRIDTKASTRGFSDNLPLNTFLASPASVKKNPISRPVRHIGPPPGFTPVLPKQSNESMPSAQFKSENQILDDYSWLDGYQLPSSTKAAGIGSSIPYPSHLSRPQVVNSNGLSGSVGFPFAGKHFSVHPQSENQNGWTDCELIERLKLNHEQQGFPHQQLIHGNQQFTSLPEQHSGQSVWAGRYFL